MTGQEAYREWLKEAGYESPSFIGGGAFARVYRCRDRHTGERHACKVSGQPARLRQEAALLRQIRHPLFPMYHGYIQEGGHGCLAMEYIEGSSLGELLGRRGRMTQMQAVRIGLALSEGLRALHERNEPLFFRDLKPENIMVCQDGSVKLLDLGCACAAGESRLSRAGTPGYAAPEQLKEGGEAGTYSDVYGWGKVMHYMLTGKDPCVPPYIPGRIRSYDRCLDKDLSWLLEECLRQDFRDRPDMRTVQYRLKRILSAGAFPPQWGRNLFARREPYMVVQSIWKSDGELCTKS